MEIIDKIRQAASIIELASHYTTLRQRGKKHIGLCPFHAEKDPSFTVDEEKQLYHCFGCGAGGDIFSLIMEKENMSFWEAVKYLAEKYHIPLPQKQKLSPEMAKLEDEIYKINENALAFFRKCLLKTEEGLGALDYLKKRNISEKTIETLRVGYAPNAWDSLLSFFKGKGVSVSLLEKAGLVIPGKGKNEYYDCFRGRIIFPIFSLAGKVMAFGGRTIFEATPKYLNSPDTPVYSKGKVLYGLNLTKEAIREKGEFFLVEGYTDFAALYQAGFTNCVATLGTSVTAEQLSLAMRFAPRAVISYDGDSAGQAASQRAISLCFEKGIQTKVVIFPENLDPDTFLRKHGVQAYSGLVQKSASGLRFLIDSAIKEGRLDIPEEKAKIIHKVMAEVAKIPDAVVRSEYMKQVSEYLACEEEILRTVMNSFEKKSEKKAPREKFLLFPAEKRLLQILLGNQALIPYVLAELREEDYQGLKSEPVFRILLDCLAKNKPLLFQKLSEELDPSLLGCLAEILLEKSDPPNYEEAIDCINTLRKISLEKRLRRIQLEITRLEKQGESEKLTPLLLEKQDLTKQLLSL